MMRYRYATLLLVCALACDRPVGQPASNVQPDCQENTGLAVPAGFCATVFADLSAAGLVRHLAVSDWGDLYVAAMAWDGRPGGVWALRDTTGDGRSDVSRRVSNLESSDVRIVGDQLYVAGHKRIVRFRLTPGQLAPSTKSETIVSDLPDGGEHRTKSIAFDSAGRILISIGSSTNTCQQQNRVVGSLGTDPCPERDDRAGVWRFENAPNQRFSDGARIATGLRNAVAFATYPANRRVYAVQHGRDDLDVLFPDLYSPERGGRNPAEELHEITEGADYGWPYCYYDVDRQAKVLAPEYGGQGDEVGRCVGSVAPLAVFPAHWAANDMVFYNGTQFPERYRGSAFLAFHGPDVRSPHTREGYLVGVVPFGPAGPAGPVEPFASMIEREPDGTPVHRPMGLAVGNDGSLYVAENMKSRIWRVFWRG